MNQKELSSEQGVLDTTIEGIKDQTYYVWELLEKKQSDLRERINMAGDEVAYRRGIQDRQLLKNAEKNPYFGSIDIITEEDGDEKFYIGKQGVRDKNGTIMVLDWRMDLATVFYNFSPGTSKQNYTVLDERLGKKYDHTVDVLKKKEFTIKNQQILKIIQQVSDDNSELNVTITENGEGLTITDDFLKEIIENSETTGYLKEIIATIQKEQDKAIRQTIDRNVIIQGVAGSGKSSIALHRLSFLLYNNKKLKPEDLLILGPSNLFISSVKDLLPELDLEGIKQSTVQDLILDVIKPVIKADFDLSYANYFNEILFINKHDDERKRIIFKGSESLTIMLDIFVSGVQSQYENRINRISFPLYGESLEKEDLLKIYNGYAYLPFAKRVERFLKHIENHYSDLMKKRLEAQQHDYNFVVDTFLKDGGLKQDDKNSLVEKMERVNNYKKNKIHSEYKKVVTPWLETMKGPDLLTIYKQALSYEVLKSLENEVGSDVPALFKNHNFKKVSYFDLAPIFYIYLLMYGVPAHFSHIVIDEAQDLSSLHFAALKKITKTMTILGDKDQSIFMDYGQYDWNSLRNSHFQLSQDMILTLDTSYRSTKEIINVANGVLINQNGILHPPIVPLNRSGEPLQFVEVQSGKNLLDNIVSTLKEWKKKYNRIAIIHKDEQKAIKLAQYLKQEYDRDIDYINPEQELANKSISVLASYYCKGMEFDAVILANINADSFPEDDLHARLLYVLLTRAQQAVKVFYQETPSPLLEGMIKNVPKITSVFDDIL